MNYLLQWLAGNLLIVTAVAAILWPLSKMSALRNRPALRHSLWLLVLVKLVTPPLVTVPVPMPTTHEVVMSSPPVVGIDLFDENILLADLPAQFPYEIDSDSMQTVAMTPVENRMTWPEVAAGLGLLSLFVTGLFWLIAVYQIRKICRLTGRFPETTDRAAKILERVAAEFKLKKCPTLVVADAACSPMLWVTWRRATIFLPRTFEQSVSDEQLRHVLAHEVAHLVRRDHLSSLVAFFVTSLFWFCPIAWLAWRETHIAMEACCDALVLDRLGGSRRSYAQTLLAAIDFAATHKSASPVLAARFGESHSLRRRVEMIANMEVKSTLSRAGRFAVLSYGLVALTLLPVWAEEKPLQVTEVVQEERPNESRDLFESRAESDGEQAETPDSRIKISCEIVELDWTKIRALALDVPFEMQRLIPYLAKDKALDALVKLNVAKVPYAPQLVTVSGRAASIKRAFMQMEALPQLQKDGTIKLHFQIEWSPPNEERKLDKSSANTVISMRNGQTVLAGGMRASETSEKSGKRESDMLVLVTAELVDSKADLSLRATETHFANATDKKAPAAPGNIWDRLVPNGKSAKSPRDEQGTSRSKLAEPRGVRMNYVVWELDRTKIRKFGIDVPDNFSHATAGASLVEMAPRLVRAGVLNGISSRTMTTPLGKLCSFAAAEHRQHFLPQLRSVPATESKMRFLPRLREDGMLDIEFRAEWERRYTKNGVEKKGLNSVSTRVQVRSGEPFAMGGLPVVITNEKGEKREVETVILILAELEPLVRAFPPARYSSPNDPTTHYGAVAANTTQILLKMKGLTVKTEPANKDSDPSEAEVISISGGKAITDEVLANLKVLPKLRELRIEYGCTVTMAGLAHVANLTALEKISLTGLHNRGDAALQSISSLKSLRELNIAGCLTTDVGIKALESMPQLTHLSIQQEGGLTDASLSSISKLKHLKYLRLPSLRTGYGPIANFSKAAMRQLSGLNELESLYVCNDVFPRELLMLPKLTSFGVQGAMGVHGTEVNETTAAQIAACPNLRSLELQFTGINDAGVKQIVAMENLRHLKIESRVITDASLKQIATMKNLRHLEINSDKTTDVGIAHLKQISALKHLMVKVNFTDKTWKNLSEIKSLTRLELQGAAVVYLSADRKVNYDFSSIQGLQQLKALPNLRELNLKHFEIPDAQIDFKELKRLDRLTLREVEISNDELNALVGVLPRTKIATASTFFEALVPLKR